VNILLTGSGGFIGRNLKEYLKDKYTLFCPRSYELDLTDQNAVEKYFNSYDINFIIHCGTTGGVRGVQDNPETLDDNIAMVNNILKYKREDCRVILFGSGAMYDKSRNLHKVRETEIGKFIPYDLYGQSKMKIAEITEKRNDLLCLNIFACYGYNEKESRFPSYAINQALRGQDIVINQNVVFDYLFVEDMQKIVEYFITNIPQHKIINITPTQSISLLEIADIVKDISGNNCKIEVKNSVMNNEYTGNNSVLLSEIKDLKFTSMQEGLLKLYNYIKLKNLETVR
jgi:NAD-dependent epimerase/dehydratase